jgi:putative oxidoreductase
MTRLTAPAIPFHTDLAALAIRAVIGPVLAYHGYLKVDRGAGRFADSMRNLEMFEVSLPRFVGYVVVVLELVGGVCLLIGLLTRVWSVLLAAQFLAIPFVVKSQAGLVAAPGGGPSGFEIDLLIAACALALVLLGPGLASLDWLLGLERAPDGET